MDECKVCANNGNEYCYVCDEGDRFEPMTNANLIRAMTDKELAETIVRIYGNGGVCPKIHKHLYCVLDNGCVKCWLAWLKAEVSK